MSTFKVTWIDRLTGNSYLFFTEAVSREQVIADTKEQLVKVGHAREDIQVEAVLVK